MKNVHLLEAKQPCRLHYYNYLEHLGLSKENLQWKQGRNIYITNNEEIKEGDWCFEVHNGDSKANSPKFIDEKGNTWWLRKANANDIAGCPTTKKIILTTDQDLIKDGVQAIDDEFLEWFVKNPSCDNVEVIYEPKNYLDVKKGWEHSLIIPKEEPKQLFTKGDKVLFTGQMLDENVVDKLVTVFYTMGTGELDDMSDIMDEYTHIYRVWNKDLKHIPKEKPKKETLEEAKERYLDSPTPHSYRLAVEFGAKWQQEQDKNKYSEEEVFEIIALFVNDAPHNTKEWFEKFKKK